MAKTVHTTTWRVPPLAWVPISLAIGAEAISNALRAYELGSHLDRLTVTIMAHSVSLAGGVLVLAAVAVSLSQARAAWIALTPGSLRQRVVAGLAALLLLAISIVAMASTILEAQRVKVSDQSGERATYARAEAAYKTAAEELAKLGTVRTTAQVRAAMDAVAIPRPVFGRTNQCTDTLAPGSYEQRTCKPLLDLRIEMASAIRKAELEPTVTSLASELASLRKPEPERATEAQVTQAWAWIMGLGVVVVATFGTVIFARVERAEMTPAPAKLAATTPEPPQPRGGIAVASRGEALADLQRLLNRGQSIPSQDWLAARWGVSKGYVSKRMAEWHEAGAIPERVQIGRCKTFEAA